MYKRTIYSSEGTAKCAVQIVLFIPGISLNVHDYIIIIIIIITTTTTTAGPGMVYWLRHCATSQKVPGSIPSGVTGDFFPWHLTIP
jgi:hypothetical protein